MSKQRKSGRERISLMVVKARRQFFKMNTREKFLAMLFAVALIGVWASFLLDRQSQVNESIRSARSVAQSQRLWIEREADIREEYQSLISQINLGALPSKEEVSSQVDSMLRRYGFASFSFGSIRTEEGTDVRFHTIPFEVKRVPPQEVRRFTEEFKSKLPYVSLERIVIRPQTKDDQFVDVNFLLKAIEYAK